MKSNNKITSIRIDTDIFETLKIYAEIENESFTDFLNRMLENALKGYFAERSGGEVMILQNPQLYDRYDKRRYLDILEKIMTVTAEISADDVSITMYLLDITKYFYKRVLYDLPEDVERYKRNHKIDRQGVTE